MPVFITQLSGFVHMWLNPSPGCGHPHLALYNALWSGSVIAGAVIDGSTQSIL